MFQAARYLLMREFFLLLLRRCLKGVFKVRFVSELKHNIVQQYKWQRFNGSELLNMYIGLLNMKMVYLAACWHWNGAVPDLQIKQWQRTGGKPLKGMHWTMWSVPLTRLHTWRSNTLMLSKVYVNELVSLHGHVSYFSWETDSLDR